MFDEYLSWKPYFEIVPMQHEDCAGVAELHALRFPRPWNDGEFSGLLTQGSVFGAVARQTNAFSANRSVVSCLRAKWPARRKS